MMPVILTHYPAGTSNRSAYHLGSLLDTGKYCTYSDQLYMLVLTNVSLYFIIIIINVIINISFQIHLISE